MFSCVEFFRHDNDPLLILEYPWWNIYLEIKDCETLQSVLLPFVLCPVGVLHNYCRVVNTEHCSCGDYTHNVEVTSQTVSSCGICKPMPLDYG